MADRYIVSSYFFCEQTSLEFAQREAARLHDKTGKPFRVYRIKTKLHRSNAFEIIEAARDVAAHWKALGFTGDESPIVARLMAAVSVPREDGEEREPDTTSNDLS